MFKKLADIFRKFAKSAKIIVLILFSIALVGTITYFVYDMFILAEPAISSEKLKQSELKKIEFKTDGVIDSKFISKILRLKNGMSLYEINIFDIKKKLENISQVRQAFVERRFPGTLFIALNERQPLLKIAVKDGEFKKIFLVDESDGEFFESACYSPEKLKDYFFAEVNLAKEKTDGKIFEPIGNVFPVVNFLKLLKMKYPKINAQVTSISLKRYDSRPGALWSRIELKTKIVKSIVFSDKNFSDQLDKLDYIINDPNIIKLMPLKKIDLSNPTNVVIKN